jgi:DNA-directed RNA polymerase specialized sigma24 family protein
MNDTQKLIKLKNDERKARLVLLKLAQTRRELVIRLRDAGMSYQQIGDIYGVTRQRAEQLSKPLTSVPAA